MKSTHAVGLSIIAALFVWFASACTRPVDKTPPPSVPPILKPDDQGKKKPKPRPKPNVDSPDDADAGKASVGGPVAPDGTHVQLDMPKDLHLRNCGGSDGAGLCVFTSLSHSAMWQNIPLLMGFRDYMKRYPGGGYPSKVTSYINKIAKEKNLPVPEYIQVESNDLEILKLACRTGRMPGITYSFSPSGRYGGGRISHMVTLVHAGVGKSGEWWAILDNNYPGTLEWMNESEFRRTYTGGSRGWAVIFLSPGPPPAPKN